MDALGEAVPFDIVRRGKRTCAATRAQQGWLRSDVFGRSFRLTPQTDPLEHPKDWLEVLA